MDPTPFQSDCQRKSQCLEDFHNRRQRRRVCANCLVLREFHYDSRCRFRRMTDPEWADYCGVAWQEPEKYLRKVQEVTQGTFVGQFYYKLECGHIEHRLVRDIDPHPKTMTCTKCKGAKMNWLNGKAKPEANALTLAPVRTSAEMAPAGNTPATSNGSTADVARYMPIMDVDDAVRRRQMLREAMENLMVEGIDYGKIPGATKPTLLQPGADKLCNLFGIDIRYAEAVREEDWMGGQHNHEPFFYYKVNGVAYRGDLRMGEGTGSCNSWESKYRWRQSERLCPACQKPNIRKSRNAEEWYCWTRTGGCGATFKIDDPAIAGQQTGRKANPDIYDQVNTILKIAYKRCKVLTTINATSASEFFTQDVEDFATGPDEPIDTGGERPGTRAAAEFVAAEKIRIGDPRSKGFQWKNMGEVREAFRTVREAVGEVAWREELERWGWNSFNDIRNALDNKAPQAREKVATLYHALLVRKEGC